MEPSSLEFSQWRQMEQLATSKREPNSSGGAPWTRGSDTSRWMEIPWAAATAHPSMPILWAHLTGKPRPLEYSGFGGNSREIQHPKGIQGVAPTHPEP